jgi:hypothetical protein
MENLFRVPMETGSVYLRIIFLSDHTLTVLTIGESLISAFENPYLAGEGFEEDDERPSSRGALRRGGLKWSWPT